MTQDLTDDKSNIGSGNGLVPSGNKPLSRPSVLNQIYVAVVSSGTEVVVCHAGTGDTIVYH